MWLIEYENKNGERKKVKANTPKECVRITYRLQSKGYEIKSVTKW